jgi:hypothetical protein
MNFIGPELAWVHPGAGFNSCNPEASPRKRQHRDTPRCAQADHGHVDRF